MMVNRIMLVALLLSMSGCVNIQECTTYECRKESIVVILEPNVIKSGEISLLSIRRTKFYMPHFRVFIGEYDDDFNLPDGVEAHYFHDTDSIASMHLSPESKGIKRIRGIIEEYNIVAADSIDSYQYPFEVILEVL